MTLHDRRMRRAEHRIKRAVISNLYGTWTIDDLQKATRLRRAVLQEALLRMCSNSRLNRHMDSRRGPSFIVSTSFREILEAEPKSKQPRSPAEVIKR